MRYNLKKLKKKKTISRKKEIGPAKSLITARTSRLLLWWLQNNTIFRQKQKPYPRPNIANARRVNFHRAGGACAYH